MTYNLVAAALHHPDAMHPYRGLFNKRTLRSLARHEACSLDVFAPIPYAPPIGPKSAYWNVPERESFDGYDVSHPRFPYLIPKSLLYAGTGELYRRVLQRATAETTPDVVHGCHVYPDGFGFTSKDAHSPPLTVTCHGHFLNNFSELPPGVAGRVRKTLETAAHVFCVSDALTEKASGVADVTDVSTVPIGADPSNFPTHREADIRESLGVEADTVLVLFCGQFIARKGIGDVIEAIEQFPVDNVEYVFVGHGGDLRDELAEAATATGAPESIRILSGISTSTLREWYAVSDLLLLPSYAEGRPTVIYEAMASETAVLSTAIEGVSEQVVDGKTGVLIEPGDRAALINSLERLTDDPRTLERMGTAGRQRLESKGWTWDDHANRVVDVHKGLL